VQLSPAGGGVVVWVKMVFGGACGCGVAEGAVVSGVGGRFGGGAPHGGHVGRVAPRVRVRDALLVAEQLPLQAVVLRLQRVDFPPKTKFVPVELHQNRKTAEHNEKHDFFNVKSVGIVNF